MGVGYRDVVFLVVVLGGTGIMGAGLLRPSGSPPAQRSEPLAVRSDLRTIVEAVDASFRDRWAEQKLVPAAPAPELAVMRRLALVLCGSVPSLEEIRRFEARPKEGRLEAWLDDLLGDRRCADYLAERFARAFVGTEDGPFLLYRRRRFIAWLSDAILENRPYDALVTRTDRRPGPLDRSSRDQFRLGHVRPGRGPADPRPTGRAGGAGVSGGADRLCPVPRPPVPALEAGRFPRPGGLLRRRPLQPAGHP